MIRRWFRRLNIFGRIRELEDASHDRASAIINLTNQLEAKVKLIGVLRESYDSLSQEADDNSREFKNMSRMFDALIIENKRLKELLK